jgi:hypothetical protein
MINIIILYDRNLNFSNPIDERTRWSNFSSNLRLFERPIKLMNCLPVNLPFEIALINE